MSNNMSTTLPGLLPSVTLTTTTTNTGTLNSSALGTGYTITSPSWNLSDAAITTTQATAALSVDGELELKGKKADVVIDGVSLKDTLKTIQERLNILIINQKLEAEWDQLRELGEQYRRLEAELLEKQRMWEIIKK